LQFETQSLQIVATLQIQHRATAGLVTRQCRSKA